MLYIRHIHYDLHTIYISGSIYVKDVKNFSNGSGILELIVRRFLVSFSLPSKIKFA